MFIVLTLALSFVTGAPLAGTQLVGHLIDFLVQWLECAGYTALVLTLLFHLQNMLVPILIYILFSSRAVYSIESIQISLSSESFAKSDSPHSYRLIIASYRGISPAERSFFQAEKEY